MLDLTEYFAVRVGFAIRTSSNPTVPFQYLSFISVEVVSSKEGPFKDRRNIIFEKINPVWDFHEGDTIHCK
jgi:hypothetical protein